MGGGLGVVEGFCSYHWSLGQNLVMCLGDTLHVLHYIIRLHE